MSSREYPRLPTELLNVIFEHFRLLNNHENPMEFDDEHGHIRARTLYSLCLVCHDFAAIARPLLYAHPTALHIAKVRRRLIRTLAERSDLADCVRYVVYGGDTSPKRKPGDDMRQLYRAIGPRVPTGKDESFLRALYSADYDAEMALLFSLVRRMSALRVCVPKICHLDMYWTLLLVSRSIMNYADFKDDGAFYSLKALQADGCGEYFSMHAVFAHRFIGLPNITEIGFCCAEETKEVPVHLWGGSSALQTLRLLNPALHHGLIINILFACKQKKHLFFIWDSHRLDYLHVFNAKAALDNCGMSVETLEFTVRGYLEISTTRARGFVEGKPIGRFRDQFMKKLKTSMFALLGVHRLDHKPSSFQEALRQTIGLFPPTLEELEIDCEGLRITIDDQDTNANHAVSIIPFLEELAVVRSFGHLPKLGTLRLKVRNSATKPRFDDVNLLLARASIKVEFLGFNEGSAVTTPDIDREMAIITPQPLGEPSSEIPDRELDAWKIFFAYLAPPSPCTQDGWLADVPWQLATLSRCRLVCKALCRIASPILFRVFSDAGTFKCRLKFINAILANPKLALMVKEIYLTHDLPDSGRALENIPPPDCQKLVEAAGKMEMADKSCWLEKVKALEHVEDKSSDADVPIFLHLVPNLEHLSLNLSKMDFFHEYSWTLLFFEPIIKHAGQSALKASPWNNLRCFSLNYDAGYFNAGPDSDAFVLDLIAAPAMKSLKCLRLGEFWATDPPLVFTEVSVKSRLTNLEHFTLDLDAIGPFAFRDLMKTLQTPMHVKFEFVPLYMELIKFSLHIKDIIVKMLLDHAECLDTLAIIPHDRLLLADIHGNYRKFMGSLKGFPALRYIETNLLFMLPSHSPRGILIEDYYTPAALDIFPDCLEGLVVDAQHTPLELTVAWMYTFVEMHKKGMLPNLLAVCLNNVKEDGNIRGLNRDVLKMGRYFANVGVMLTMDDIWEAGEFFRELDSFSPNNINYDSMSSSSGDEYEFSDESPFDDSEASDDDE